MTVVWIAAAVVCCVHFVLRVAAEPVAPCIERNSDVGRAAAVATTSLFVADTRDRCAFHWCIAGRWLQTEPFVCPGGTAVRQGYVGTANPCSADAPGVSLCQVNAPSASRPQQTFPGTLQVAGLPSDHHPAALTWKVIDLTTEQHQTQQQQQDEEEEEETVEPVQWPPMQYVQNSGQRHYVAKAYVTRNVRVRGGKPVQFARSLPRCWKACLSRVACRGFDFLTSRQVSPPGNTRCFLHGQQSICNQYEHMPGFDNYRFHVCEWTKNASRTPSNSSSILPGYVESIPRRHVAGGRLLRNVRSAADCVAHCVHEGRRRRRHSDRCVAVDFDMSNNTCWLHSPTTGCVSDSMLYTLDSSTHYRVRRHECDNLKGYVVPGVHSLGGTYQPGIRDVMTCYRACSTSPDCTAVDFDSADNSCWFHLGPTTCSRVDAAPSTLQIRRRRDCS